MKVATITHSDTTTPRAALPRWLCELLVLTYDEEGFYNNIRRHCEAFEILDKGCIVGNGHGYVDGGDQNQPVPAALEHAVMGQDEPGFFQRLGLVLGQRGVRGM